MPNPKRKHSKQRRDKRRAHHKAEIPTLSICQNCGSTVQYHRVCPECGHYKGKPAVEKEISA